MQSSSPGSEVSPEAPAGLPQAGVTAPRVADRKPYKPRPPHSPITKELIQSRCVTNPKTGCWEWQGARHKHGYGEIRDGAIGVRASRKAYELWKGPIPAGIRVCHQCDNPPCCNPEHLFLGTQKQNMEDASRKGRIARKLTLGQVVAIRHDQRLYRVIGEEYSVSIALISEIKTGKHRPECQ